MSDMMYILQDHEPVSATLMEWAKWSETAVDERRVAENHIGDAWVSTVFLGLDHRFFGAGPPLLFETMIFGGTKDQYQERCSTWVEAKAMHARAVELATAA